MTRAKASRKEIQSRCAKYALFTGIQLVLESIGHRDIPPTVRVIVPAGWKAASALRETADSMRFTARHNDQRAHRNASVRRIDRTVRTGARERALPAVTSTTI